MLKWLMLNSVFSLLLMAEGDHLLSKRTIDESIPVLDSSDSSCPKGFPIPESGLPRKAVYVGKDRARYVIPVKKEDLDEGDVLVTSRKEMPVKNNPYSEILGGHFHTQLLASVKGNLKTICTRKVHDDIDTNNYSKEVIRLKKYEINLDILNDESKNKLVTLNNNRNEALKAVANWSKFFENTKSELVFTESIAFSEKDFQLVKLASKGKLDDKIQITTYCSNAATLPFQVQIGEGMLEKLPIGEASFTALKIFWEEVDSDMDMGFNSEKAIERQFEKLIFAATDMVDGKGVEQFKDFKKKNDGKDWKLALAGLKAIRSFPARSVLTARLLKMYTKDMAISPADLVVGSRSGIGPFQHIGTYISPACKRLKPEEL